MVFINAHFRCNLLFQLYLNEQQIWLEYSAEPVQPTSEFNRQKNVITRFMWFYANEKVSSRTKGQLATWSSQ